jgi:spermidine/putrescine transport system ATP-binding protein
MGENGAGKSTLLGMLTADHPQIYNNDITLLGERPGHGLNIWDHKAKLGFFSPELALQYREDLSLLDVLCTGFTPNLCRAENITWEERAKARDWLNYLGFEDTSISIRKISPIDKRLVLMARAAIRPPKVLLLDEPLSALDAKLRSNLLVDLDALHDKIGITFIYVTHDQSEALAVSDRIAVMNQGHVLQVGTPFEIYESPATQFVAQFIGETNLFESTVVKCEEYKAASGDTEYNVTLNTPALGMQAQLTGETAAMREEDKNILVTDYEHTSEGQKVAFTIRPEKIRITTEEPKFAGRKDINVFKGVVEEPVYTGFQSKFYVRLENGTIVKVFKQHINYMDDGPEIAWKDTVYLSWAANDGYIVEDILK